MMPMNTTSSGFPLPFSMPMEGLGGLASLQSEASVLSGAEGRAGSAGGGRQRGTKRARDESAEKKPLTDYQAFMK